MFSKNDELDDITTGTLKFLLLPYYVADLLIKIVDSSHLAHLLAAKALLLHFVEKCRALSILKDSEFEQLLEGNPGDRQARITRHKKEREVDARLGALCQRRKRLAKKKAGAAAEDEPVPEEDESLAEEVDREYQLLLLEQCLRKAADKLHMCGKEIELLSLSQQQKDDAVEDHRRRQEEAAKGPKVDPVLIVPRQLEERERILGQMFNPQSLPTMTIDEYMALHPEEFAGQTSAPPPAKKSEEEEEDEDGDAATYKKRQWDDWTDHNPKGAGNRKGNTG
eukprot:NODE_616_length_1263_cov_280.175453_g444_i0.p1 GENE.NODE_616_length_1263_cov_280.175453_g444_i0~~NODE_616_length_1263_cov_280.175453_g444_i0.p1  ORF type:complete len:280 (-),score=80.68 NODE_616_length_1263_cov_280.175453_g444_i0:87-926(-)